MPTKIDHFSYSYRNSGRIRYVKYEPDDDPLFDALSQLDYEIFLAQNKMASERRKAKKNAAPKTELPRP